MKKKLQLFLIIGGIIAPFFAPSAKGAQSVTLQMKTEIRTVCSVADANVNEPWMVPALLYKVSGPSSGLASTSRRNGQVKKIRMPHTIDAKFLQLSSPARSTENGNQVYLDAAGNYLYVTGEFNLLSLYSLTGSVVMRTRENITDVRHLSSGVYLAKIDSKDQQSITRKLIKR